VLARVLLAVGGDHTRFLKTGEDGFCDLPRIVPGGGETAPFKTEAYA
jgi:hypothetical protein